jgi:outer membrane protein TolC
LPGAINRAIEHNLELARSVGLLARTEFSVQRAQSAFTVRYRPDSNVQLSEGRRDWQYGAAAVKRLPWGTEVTLGGSVNEADTDNGREGPTTKVSVGLQQPLFRYFGSLANQEPVMQARSSLKRARRDYERQKTDLVVRVVETYEAIVSLKRRIEFDTAFLGRIEKLLQLTQARERQGRSSRVDVLKVELQRGQAASRLANSRESLASSERNLAELLGYSLETHFDPDPLAPLDLPVPAAAEAVQMALSNRLDYAQALQDYDDAQRGLKIAGRAGYPDIGLNTHYSRPVASSDGDQRAYWFAGLTAGSDFNRAESQAVLGQAREDEQAGRWAVAIGELSIAREVQDQLGQHRQAQTELRIAERNVKVAEGRAALARRLFSVGRADSFAVTDAEDGYVQAENQLIDARASAVISGYRMLRALGTLVEYPSDLKPGQKELLP